MDGIFQAKVAELLKIFRQGNMKCLRWWKGSHRVVLGVVEFVTESKETEKKVGRLWQIPLGSN